MNIKNYAFPGDREGDISIEMESYDNKYLLIVRDNGVGFPPALDFRDTNSLGLQLVNAFTAQLKGVIEFVNTEFTEFRIIFPKTFQGELSQPIEYEWAFCSARKYL